MQRFAASVLVGAAIAAVAEAGPPWGSRDDIPSGCVPTTKVPDGGRCLFDDQCVSSFCCPYYRSCIGPDPGYLRYEDVEVDPVRHAMMWGIGGDVGSYDGVQNHVLEGATDTCDRDRVADSFGLCGGFTMNDMFTVALQDEGSFLRAFNLNDPECACDDRFKDLYTDNSWTGAFIDGEFRNYCDLEGWDYVLSEKGADRCPEGRSIITNVAECQAAVTYLGLGDSTSYMGGSFGPSAFPGCANNAINNQVAFNGDNAAAVFQLSGTEQFVCKRGGAADVGGGDTATTPTVSFAPDRNPTCVRLSEERLQRIRLHGREPMQC